MTDNDVRIEVMKHCKEHNLKLEDFNRSSFIASKLIDVKAGMEFDIHTGKVKSIPIKKIGKKRIYRKYLIFIDSKNRDIDVVDDGIINY